MSLEIFQVSETNPNDDIGGGGCACSPEQKTSYCHPPYVVFYAASSDESYSPHLVVCQRCIDAAAEALGLEDPEPIDADAEELDVRQEITV
jgi:hypothetical protein